MLKVFRDGWIYIVGFRVDFTATAVPNVVCRIHDRLRHERFYGSFINGRMSAGTLVSRIKILRYEHRHSKWKAAYTTVVRTEDFEGILMVDHGCAYDSAPATYTTYARGTGDVYFVLYVTPETTVCGRCDLRSIRTKTSIKVSWYRVEFLHSYITDSSS